MQPVPDYRREPGRRRSSPGGVLPRPIRRGGRELVRQRPRGQSDRTAAGVHQHCTRGRGGHRAHIPLAFRVRGCSPAGQSPAGHPSGGVPPGLSCRNPRVVRRLRRRPGPGEQAAGHRQRGRVRGSAPSGSGHAANGGSLLRTAAGLVRPVAGAQTTRQLDGLPRGQRGEQSRRLRVRGARGRQRRGLGQPARRATVRLRRTDDLVGIHAQGDAPDLRTGHGPDEASDGR